MKLGVQEDIRVSLKNLAGNMSASINQVVPVFVLNQLVQLSKSVGIIRAPSVCGTGFRVGPNYVMTAKHLIDAILRNYTVSLHQHMHGADYQLLSDTKVYIDFSYESYGVPADENLRFYFEPEIVYANDMLDTAVLKLKPHVNGYPPPLTKFASVTPSYPGISGYFIGHTKADIKKIDQYNHVIFRPDVIIAARKWSIDYVKVDGYIGIEDPRRVLFHCSFEKGAAGSPGFWIASQDGQAYVELMLLCGYPSWYYDDAYRGKIFGIPDNIRVEQGVSMRSVYEDMKNTNGSLCIAIFHNVNDDNDANVESESIPASQVVIPSLQPALISHCLPKSIPLQQELQLTSFPSQLTQLQGQASRPGEEGPGGSEGGAIAEMGQVSRPGEEGPGGAEGGAVAEMETQGHAENSSGVPVGFDRIKNIFFQKGAVLGHGCHGTIVYRGKFDERDVAVKRLQREYFSLADREVTLLRKSDQHPNVIRYFCMEKDSNFLFIALELCEGTLQDYVEGKFQSTISISPIELLRQVLSGLAHLHSLDIVHRDIKPHNILISSPSAHGEVRVVISDFGLSKMLPPGQATFSSKSDVFGTVGWTAPEMLKKGVKRTLAVDIFSTGCLIYYVLTMGLHPFGNDSSEIQYHIQRGIFNLDELPMTSDGEIAKDIIQKMLSLETRTRPTAKAVLHHPLFWNEEKKLAFIQDASDWIKVKNVPNLEQDGAKIVRVDWTKCLCQELQNDIQHKKRGHCNGSTVKGLLRVIRNKRHHYNEIPEVVKKSLGSLPEKFLDYFTSRFPLLLIHTYRVMECCSMEDTFRAYYKT